MRIRVSNPGRFKEYQAGQIDDFLWELKETILSWMGSETYKISQYRIQKLQAELNKAVHAEVGSIFETMVEIIQNSRSYSYAAIRTPYIRAPEVPGFSSDNLFKAKSMTQMAAMPVGGEVNWLDLTQKWVQKKKRTGRRGSESKFFIYTGRLLGRLKGQAAESASTRFGGVDMRQTMRTDLKPRRLRRGDAEWTLDKLVIEVFPNIPSLLLPMLTSFDWKDHSEGSFERRMIGGMTGEKLAGPPGYHRPLLQPLVQFWIAYRLPRVVAHTIESVMRDDGRPTF